MFDSGAYEMVAEALKYKVPMVSRNARKGAFGLIGLSVLNNGPIYLSGGPLQPKNELHRPGNGCSLMLVSQEAKPMQCLADNMVPMWERRRIHVTMYR